VGIDVLSIALDLAMRPDASARMMPLALAPALLAASALVLLAGHAARERSST
jgi:hypothetical protein